MNSNYVAPLQSSSDNFKFKYVAEEELLRIVRKVRREKQKEKDALQWEQFMENKNKNTSSDPQPIADLEEPHLASSMNEVHLSKDEIKIGLQSEYAQGSVPFEDHSKRSIPTDAATTTREAGSLQRIALLRHRISLVLDSISGMIQCRPAEPDGPDDLERRKTRINEFLSRFSRNYLFQFQRQVTELRRHIVCASPETPGRHTEYQALVQKLVSAHQMAVQSLQAYLTQIPASLQVTNIFGKLRDLLYQLCDLSLLKNQLHAHSGMIDGYDDVEDADEVVQKCRDLLVLLDEKQAEAEDVSVSARASSPLSGRGSLRPRTQRVLNRANAGLNQSSWKKTSASLARAKFGTPSTVRSSVSPHVSSRGHHSNEKKRVSDEQPYPCCNSELRDIVTHMHDVICNKIARKRKKRKDKYLRSKDGIILEDRNKSTSRQKPLTKVKNFSNNVQLVYTKHSDNRDDGLKDVATDTADLSIDKKSEGDLKKVRTVERTTSKFNHPTPENKTNIPSEKTFVVTPHQSADDSSEHHGDNTMRHRGVQDKRLFSYKQKFQDYNDKVQNPLVQRWCENILDNVFQEISHELEPSFLLEKMYHLEFKDSTPQVSSEKQE